MRLQRFFLLAAIVIFASLTSWAQGRGYKLVVNASNPASSMSRAEVERIFLKRSMKFPDGRGASPVDLPVNSSVRDSFSKDVHGKSASAVDAYWQQQIFSGKDIPPAQKSEAAALEFVRSNENGIAYVSAGADAAGVKVITVTD